MGRTIATVKVFIAGATGVLGRRVVPLVVAAGHDVSALARSDARAAMVGSLGASPVRADLFDPEAMRQAVAGHDVVCNLATHIPPTAKAARPGAWAQNNQIRTEGSKNLVDAALACGASRYVQESIAFLYVDGGSAWIDESSPIDPVANLGSATVAESHAARVTAAGANGGGPALLCLLRARQRVHPGHDQAGPETHRPERGPRPASRRRSPPTMPPRPWWRRWARRPGSTTWVTTNR